MLVHKALALSLLAMCVAVLGATGSDDANSYPDTPQQACDQFLRAIFEQHNIARADHYLATSAIVKLTDKGASGGSVTSSAPAVGVLRSIGGFAITSPSRLVHAGPLVITQVDATATCSSGIAYFYANPHGGAAFTDWSSRSVEGVGMTVRRTHRGWLITAVSADWTGGVD